MGLTLRINIQNSVFFRKLSLCKFRSCSNAPFPNLLKLLHSPATTFLQQPLFFCKQSGVPCSAIASILMNDIAKWKTDMEVPVLLDRPVRTILWTHTSHRSRIGCPYTPAFSQYLLSMKKFYVQYTVKFLETGTNRVLHVTNTLT